MSRAHYQIVGDVLEPLTQSGQIATCGMLELEVLFSARNLTDLRKTRAVRAVAYVSIAMEQRDFDRAADVMESLAGHGLHRAAAIPDLLIAAVAERAGLTVLHYDQDFEAIASVTGQPQEWVVPRGTV